MACFNCRHPALLVGDTIDGRSILWCPRCGTLFEKAAGQSEAQPLFAEEGDTMKIPTLVDNALRLVRSVAEFGPLGTPAYLVNSVRAAAGDGSPDCEE